MSTFKAGDRVRKKNGEEFSNGESVCTVSYVENGRRVYMAETGFWLDNYHLELAQPEKIHPHHDIIISWLNGEEVESKRPLNDWVTIQSVRTVVEKRLSVCAFNPDTEYRLKPKKSEKDLKIEELQRKMDEIKEQMEQLKGG